MAEKENRTEVVNVYLTTFEKQKIRRAAAADSLTPGSWARRALLKQAQEEHPE